MFDQRDREISRRPTKSRRMVSSEIQGQQEGRRKHQQDKVHSLDFQQRLRVEVRTAQQWASL